MLATPIFDSALLGDVFDAFQRRGKAIRYHGPLECSRDVEQGNERLNIDMAVTGSVRLRLSLWPDGAFWLAVTKPGPRRAGGWQIHEQIEGTLAVIPPSEIVALFESTMSSPTDAARIWHNPPIEPMAPPPPCPNNEDPSAPIRARSCPR